MKRLFSLYLLLFTFLISFSQSQMKDATTFFNLLIDCNSLEEMEKICKDYGLRPHPSQDGYQIYTYDDGTKIKFKINESPIGIPLPVIETVTKKNKKTVVEKLNSIGFVEENGVFYKGHKYGQTRKQAIIKENKKEKTITFIVEKIQN